MTCFQHSKCAIDDWTNNKDLNPLIVDRLCYRSPTDTILDFLLAGNLIDRVEYSDSDDDIDDVSLSDNYFEDTSRSIDNLHDFKQSLEENIERDSYSDLSTGEPELANSKAKATAQPVEKPEITNEKK